MKNLTAFILTGGESRRMGHPKAEIEIKGEMVLERLTTLAKEISSSIYIVGKKEVSLQNLPFLVDGWELQTPLVGIATALKNSKTDWNLILACDYPLMEKKILKRILESKTEGFDAIVPQIENQLHPLVALYHQRILEKIESRLDRKKLSVHGLLDEISVNKVEMDDKIIGSGFLNMNDQNDLAKVETILSHPK